MSLHKYSIVLLALLALLCSCHDEDKGDIPQSDERTADFIVALLQDIIQDVYMVLIMSVNPGFGGQKFIEHSVEKVRELRALIERTGSKALIEVDGGVNLETGARLVEAGADVLVAGNAVFGAPDPEEMIRQLHEL